MSGFDEGAWKDLVRNNGQIPLDMLRVVEGAGLDRDRNAPHLMEPHAAANLELLLAAAQADGVSLPVLYSYRTLATQREKYEDFKNGDGNLAAFPGTSNHGWGLTVDFDSTDQNVAWLQRHADRFGFVGDVPSERWHYTYSGGGPAEVSEMTPDQEQTLVDAAAFLGTLEDGIRARGPRSAGARVARSVARTEARARRRRPGTRDAQP
jgi:LAS superfamily LD-carboxypeptidase LdcB